MRFHLLFGLLLLAAIPRVSLAEMKAGLASIVITPKEYLWMSGYAARTKPAEGKLHDLYAKAIAIEDGQGTQAVIVTTDLIGVSAELTQNVVSRVQDKTGIPRKAIMLTSSHTHSGPVIRTNLKTMYELEPVMWNKISEYTKNLEDKLVQVILQAVENIQPAELSRGTGRADFAANRRVYTYDGMTFGVNPIGPVDYDVPFLQVKNTQHEQLGLLFGYACHNTTLDGYQYNGDYAGFAQAFLDRVFPGDVHLFFAGCGGDINPNPRREIALAKQHGEELGQAVVAALAHDMQNVDGTIKLAYSELQVPLSTPPDKEQLKQQLEDSNKYVRLLSQSLSKQIEQEGSLPDSYPVPIQVWSINDWLIIALGGEAVVDYALLFKDKYGAENTWVIAYANDVMCYIPSLRVLQEGGYEAETSMIYYGFHGPWQPQIQELIIEEVDRLVNMLD